MALAVVVSWLRPHLSCDGLSGLASRAVHASYRSVANCILAEERKRGVGAGGGGGSALIDLACSVFKKTTHCSCKVEHLVCRGPHGKPLARSFYGNGADSIKNIVAVHDREPVHLLQEGPGDGIVRRSAQQLRKIAAGADGRDRTPCAATPPR